MKSLVISEAASGDLASIGEYTERAWGLAQKKRHLAALEECFRRIREAPSMGAPRVDVRHGYRSCACGRHIFYRERGKAVEIVRVLHQRMDMHRHLGERD